MSALTAATLALVSLENGRARPPIRVKRKRGRPRKNPRKYTTLLTGEKAKPKRSRGAPPRLGAEDVARYLNELDGLKAEIAAKDGRLLTDSAAIRLHATSYYLTWLRDKTWPGKAPRPAPAAMLYREAKRKSDPNYVDPSQLEIQHEAKRLVDRQMNRLTTQVSRFRKRDPRPK